MRKTVILGFFFFLFISYFSIFGTMLDSKAQDMSELVWEKIYGGTGADLGWCVIQTDNGGYAITGSTWTSRGKEAWLVKADKNGLFQWNQTYGGISASGLCVIKSSDGGYAIVGNRRSVNLDMDVWLIKTDQDGILLWSETYGGTGADFGTCIVETSDGGHVITGYTYSNGDADFWLGKTDSSGVLLWNHTYGGEQEDYAFSLVESSDGGFVIIGVTQSFGTGGDNVWLGKTDSSGVLLWSQTYGGEGYGGGRCVLETVDGGYIIAGYTSSFGAGDADFWLGKTDSSGVLLWNHTYGGEQEDYAFSLVESSDGGFVIAGFTWSFSVGENDLWIVKTDDFGIVVWNQTFGGLGWDEGRCVIQDSDGDHVVSGSSSSFGDGSSDLYLIKIDSSLLPVVSPNPSPEPEPFPTTIAVVSITITVVVGLGLLIYFKKR